MLFIPEFIEYMLVLQVAILVPVAIIYKRIGFNPIWTLLLIIPVLGLLLVASHLALFPWSIQKSKHSGEL